MGWKLFIDKFTLDTSSNRTGSLFVSFSRGKARHIVPRLAPRNTWHLDEPPFGECQRARVCVWGCVCRTRQAVVSRTPVCFTTHSNVLPFPLSRLYNSDPSSLRHLNICIIPAFQATSPNMGMRKPLSWAKTLSRFSMIDILYQYRTELVVFTS